MTNMKRFDKFILSIIAVTSLVFGSATVAVAGGTLPNVGTTRYVSTSNGPGVVKETGQMRKYNAAAGGNSVYVKITNSTYRPSSGFVTATSIRWNDYTWKSYSVTLRAPWIDKSQLCEDIRYRVDPCS